MVITIDSGAQALIYELALIPAILDWIGLDWIGSAKMDPCPTLNPCIHRECESSQQQKIWK